MSAGQASRTTLLAEGAAAVAGDVAKTGASFKNEIEAAIAIRCCPALRLSQRASAKRMARFRVYNTETHIIPTHDAGCYKFFCLVGICKAHRYI